MAYILILGAFLFFAARVFGRRTITPQISREAEPERPMTASIWSEPAETERATQVPTGPAGSAGPSDYLLGGQRAGGAPDATAAMIDMMSGPGLCTPPAP